MSDSYPVPLDIDPAVLQPGARVIPVLDTSAEPLTVLRVELCLICRAADGSQHALLAHTVVLADDVGAAPTNPAAHVQDVEPANLLHMPERDPDGNL